MQSYEEADVAALFDLDGVLVDSEREYTRFWSHIDQVYPTGVKDFALVIKGTTLHEILGRYYPPEHHQDIVAALDEAERTMRYDIKPGVTELLQGLRNRNVPAVMVTSSNNEKMSHLWQQHPELKEYFTHIVTADMVHQSKPDPEGYLLGARLAGVPAARCAVFEDSAQGVLAGKNAGAFVVAVAGTLDADILRNDADMVVDTLLDFNIDHLINVLEIREI